MDNKFQAETPAEEIEENVSQEELDENLEEKSEGNTEETVEIEDVIEISEEDGEVSEYNDAATQIAEMETALEEESNKFRMLFAEFDNYRKRTEKEKFETFNVATMKCIEKLLPVIDSIEKGVNAPCTDENYKNGILLTYKQLESFLEKCGVSAFGECGDDFDPNIHSAVSSIDSEDYESGKICQVYMKGYKCGEKLLRPAMTVVAN